MADETEKCVLDIAIGPQIIRIIKIQAANLERECQFSSFCYGLLGHRNGERCFRRGGQQRGQSGRLRPFFRFCVHRRRLGIERVQRDAGRQVRDKRQSVGLVLVATCFLRVLRIQSDISRREKTLTIELINAVVDRKVQIFLQLTNDDLAKLHTG